MKRDGFTIVEMVFVILIIGLIANLSFPYISNVRVGADASNAMSELNTIRLAGFDHYVATGEFPPTAGFGQVPPEMVDKLPEDFDFHFQDATYMWISLVYQGRHIAGPLVVGPEPLIQNIAQLSSAVKVQGPTFVVFLYES